MATKWEAGHAFVSIIPSMDGFHRRLQRELAKYNDEIKVPVDADTKRAQENVDRLVKDAQNRTAEVKVNADTSQAEAKIREMEARKSAATIQVDADIERARARIAELEGKRGKTSIDVDAEISAAQAKIASLQAKREAITIRADADTAAASAKLAALDNQTSSLNGRRAVVGAEVQGAERGIHLLSGLTAATAALGAMGPVAAAGIATISPAVIGLGLAATTMIVGFNGVGTAISAVNAVADEFGNATPAQIDKMNDAMAALTQEGRNFVMFFTGEFRATMQGIGNSVQSALLPYMEQSLRNLMGLAPQVTAALSGTAHVLGQLALQGSAMMTSGPWTQDFMTLSAATNSMLWSLGQAGLQLADAFRSITVAALPLAMRIVETMQNSALMFNAWIQGARDSGQLGVWFSQMGETLFRVGEVVKNVVIALFNLSMALAPIGSLMLNIVNGIANFITWISQAIPGLLQFIAVGYIATSAFIGLGTAIGGLYATGKNAVLGFQMLMATMALVPARAGAAAASIAGAAGATNAVAGGAGAAVSGLTRWVGYLGIAGLAIGAAALVIDGLTTSVDEAAQAYLRGGSAAEAARNAMSSQLDPMYGLRLGFADLLTWLNPFASATDYQANRQYYQNEQMQAATARMQEMLAAMSPLERAQALVTQATNDHAWAVERFGMNSPQAAAAAGHLAFQTNQLEWQQHLAAEAAKSHTDKLVEQQNQMISMLQSDLAYRMSLQQVDQAQRALTDAVRQHGAGSFEAQQAELQYEQSLLRAAEASRKNAEEQYKGWDASEKARLGTEAYNREIFNLVQKAGDQAPAALRNYIGSLDLSTLRAIGARVETDNFGNAVVRLPNGKVIPITTPGINEALRYTDDLKRKIDSIPAEKSIMIHIDRILGPGLQQSNPNSGIPLPLGNANGRIAQFAKGGFAGTGLSPMSPIAQMVPPNTWRVVGDRMQDDEAYIPLDGSARSMAILAEAAKRMGAQLLPTGTTAQPMAEGGVIATPDAGTAAQANAAISSLPTPEQIRAVTEAFKLLDAAVILFNANVGLLNIGVAVLNGTLGLFNLSLGGANLALGALGLGMGFANGAVMFFNGTVLASVANLGMFNGAMGFVNGTILATTGSLGILNGALGFVNGNILASSANFGLLNAALGILNGSVMATNLSLGFFNGALGLVNGSVLATNFSLGILNGTTGIYGGTVAATTGTVGLFTGAQYGLRDALIAQDIQARINNGTGIALHGTLGQWRFLVDQLSLATTNLKNQTQDLNAGGLSPLVNQLNGSTIPTLQTLELHAGILTPQAIRTLDNMMDPLARSFEGAGFRMRDQFQQTTNHIGVKNGEIQGHFRSLTDGMLGTEHAIFLASQGIRGHWEAIKGYAHGPMKWVVDVVWNTGLLPIWNGVAGIFGQPPLAPVQFRNSGGPINGLNGGRVPGAGDKDTVPAMLTPGEYVISKPVVDKWGLGNINAAHQAARQGSKVGPEGMMLNSGGPVQHFAAGGEVALRRAMDFARSMNGKRYVWGGGSSAGTDCSGYMAMIKRALLDERPYDRREWSTHVAQGGGSPPGFAPGLSAGFSIGISHGGVGHTAGTLGGAFGLPAVNVEAGGDHNTSAFGGPAAGADHSQFKQHFHIPMIEGMFVSGGGGGGGMVDPRVLRAMEDMKRLKGRIDPGVNGFFGGRGELAWPGLQRSHAHTVVDGLLKKMNDYVAAASAVGGGTASSNPEAVAGVRETARQFGWDQGPEWDALFRLVQNESGWNPGAANPTSSARGLFQKMTNIHGPIEPTPGGQALWGLNYIKGRYGSPSAALNFWNSHNPHWYNQGGEVKPYLYDEGGWLSPGANYTYNGTRKPEAVLTSEDYAMMHNAATNGGQVTTNVYAAPDWSPERVGRAVNRHVDNALRN